MVRGALGVLALLSHQVEQHTVLGGVRLAVLQQPTDRGTGGGDALELPGVRVQVPALATADVQLVVDPLAELLAHRAVRLGQVEGAGEQLRHPLRLSTGQARVVHVEPGRVEDRVDVSTRRHQVDQDRAGDGRLSGVVLDPAGPRLDLDTGVRQRRHHRLDGGEVGVLPSQQRLELVDLLDVHRLAEARDLAQHLDGVGGVLGPEELPHVLTEVDAEDGEGVLE